MLHYEALRQLTHERCRQRELEAQTDRLAQEARGTRQTRRRRSARPAARQLLTTRQREAEQQAGA